MAERDEEELLKSAALRNSQTIFAVRQQAERDLIKAKEELARKVGELAEEREWLRTVLSSISDAVITVDIHGKITFLNPEAELLTGWNSSDALGQPLQSVMNIIDEKTRESTPNRIADVLRKGISAGPPRCSILIGRNDGMEARIEDTVTPVRNAAGAVFGVVLVFRDMAERTRTE